MLELYSKLCIIYSSTPSMNMTGDVVHDDRVQKTLERIAERNAASCDMIRILPSYLRRSISPGCGSALHRC